MFIDRRRTLMEIGSLEYVVLGIEDPRFASEVLPELNALQKSGPIRIVDLVFVRKGTGGTVVLQEVGELNEEEQAAYEGLINDLTGLLTAEDIEQLGKQIPDGTSAVIMLFEHGWTLQLMDAIRRADGVLLTGGMVAPDASEKVNAELAIAKEDHHA
jgi:uncharacterized membrane protein